MGEVVDLRRKPPERAGAIKPRPSGKTVYYCLKCMGDVFELHESGQVFCHSCSSLMRNLHTTMTGSPAI
jgi:hypothetical protein